MDVPDWLVSSAPVLSHSALRVGLGLVVRGSPALGPGGGRAWRYRGTRARLARLSGCSVRSVDAALAELSEAGFVVRHGVVDGRSLAVSLLAEGVTVAPSFALDEEQGATVAPIEGDSDRKGATVAPIERDSVCNGATVAPIREMKPQRGGAAHDDDVGVGRSDRDQENNSMHEDFRREARPEELERMRRQGCTNPEAWVARFGAAASLRALEWARTTTARNPAGLAYSLLAQGRLIPAPHRPRAGPREGSGEEDSLEARMERYLGGPLGEIVRYR